MTISKRKIVKNQRKFQNSMHFTQLPRQIRFILRSNKSKDVITRRTLAWNTLPKFKKTQKFCNTAVIYDGTEGLGRMLGQHLLDNETNRVVLLGPDPASGVKAVDDIVCRFGSRKAVFYKVKICCNKSLTDVLRNIRDEFGKISAFINTAPIWDGCDWRKELDLNLVGTINSTLLLPKYMEPGGIIINVSGIGGLEPIPYSPILSAEQSAIVSFTRSLLMQTFSSQLRLMCICPGFMKVEAHKVAPLHQDTATSTNQLQQYLKCKPSQCAWTVVRAIFHLMQFENNGIYAVDQGELYKLCFADWKTSTERICVCS